MSDKIIVPTLGESVTEATVSKWLKSQGEKVIADEPLVELETDKVNVEVPAPSNGVLICKGIRSKRFKLTGATNLWSDNIEYYFYKNKLFELDVDYYPLKYKNSNKEIKHSLDNLLKRLNENDNIVPIAKWSSRARHYGNLQIDD